MEVAEIRTLRGITRLDTIRNERKFRNSGENRLRWCGYVERRKSQETVQKKMEVKVEGSPGR